MPTLRPILMLAALVIPMAVLASEKVEENVPLYCGLFLFLQAGLFGAFTALNFFHWFLFWELSLIPAFFLIKLWGGSQRSEAALQFFVYTMVGSIALLLAFLGLFLATGTFDFTKLADLARAKTLGPLVQSKFAWLGWGAGKAYLVLFLGALLGFAVKVPLWPFHTWLPDAHTEAPTIGSVLLAGIMLKMGTYGFVRIALPLLPEGAKAYAPWIGLLSAIAIVYAALACLAQKDLKRLIAFSSVGHMGFVMLGISTLTAIGINAAIFGMVAHGVITGMLFFCVGSIYDRYHTREIAEIGGGMMQKMPFLAGTFAFVSIASLGLPGLAGFWGEFPAILSAYQPAPGLPEETFRTFMVIAALGTVLAAGYLLWLYQRTAFGQVSAEFGGGDHGHDAHGHGESHGDDHGHSDIHDVTEHEWWAWTPLLIAIVVFGVYPQLMFKVLDPAVTHLFGK